VDSRVPIVFVGMAEIIVKSVEASDGCTSPRGSICVHGGARRAVSHSAAIVISLGYMATCMILYLLYPHFLLESLDFS
jgi:hypothetical protein